MFKCLPTRHCFSITKVTVRQNELDPTSRQNALSSPLGETQKLNLSIPSTSAAPAWKNNKKTHSSVSWLLAVVTCVKFCLSVWAFWEHHGLTWKYIQAGPQKNNNNKTGRNGFSVFHFRAWITNAEGIRTTVLRVQVLCPMQIYPTEPSFQHKQNNRKTRQWVKTTTKVNQQHCSINCSGLLPNMEQRKIRDKVLHCENILDGNAKWICLPCTLSAHHFHQNKWKLNSHLQTSDEHLFHSHEQKW